MKLMLLELLNVFEAARNCSKLKAILNITSDKCYENDGRLMAIKNMTQWVVMIHIVVVKVVRSWLTSSYRSLIF